MSDEDLRDPNVSHHWMMREVFPRDLDYQHRYISALRRKALRDGKHWPENWSYDDFLHAQETRRDKIITWIGFAVSLTIALIVLYLLATA